MTPSPAVLASLPGQPPWPTRLGALLLILKHLHDLSDESLSARWLENPYCQHFRGEEGFQHRLPFERFSLTRWRQRLAAWRRPNPPNTNARRCRRIRSLISSDAGRA